MPIRQIVRKRRPTGFRIARRIYWVVVVGDDVRMTGKLESSFDKSMIVACAGFDKNAQADIHPSTARKKDAERLVKLLRAATAARKQPATES